MIEPVKAKGLALGIIPTIPYKSTMVDLESGDLLLLMTDPSTSPRTNVGRTLFGLGYGFGYVIAFEILGKMGAPELYAKLYPVPILNLTVQFLDRLARRGAVGRLNAEGGRLRGWKLWTSSSTSIGALRGCLKCRVQKGWQR